MKPAAKGGQPDNWPEQAVPVARHRRRSLKDGRSLVSSRAFPGELPRTQQANAMHGHDSRLPSLMLFSQLTGQYRGPPQDIENALVYETDRRYTSAALSEHLAMDWLLSVSSFVKWSLRQNNVAAGFVSSSVEEGIP